MIFLDTRYVSPLLTNTLTTVRETIFDVTHGCFLSAASPFQEWNICTGIMMNAEMGMEALNEFLRDHHVTKMANIFKNKMAFRKLMASKYPNFFYRSCTLSELQENTGKDLPFPIILKPIAGYCSKGVYKFNDSRSLAQFIHTYQTIDAAENTQFLIEEYIVGKEFAVDFYFDKEGEPVLLNIFERKCKDSNEMGGRICYTSKKVLSTYIEPFYHYLKEFGESFHLKMMPLHIELRVNTRQEIIPIEVHPLRFADEGTTELGYFAYGVNPYEYYFSQRKPAWNNIIAAMDDSIYSFARAEMDQGLAPEQIKKIDHYSLKEEFKEILDYRILPLDGRATFAVIFFKSENEAEHDHIVNLDFMDFITCKQYQLQ